MDEEEGEGTQLPPRPLSLPALARGGERTSGARAPRYKSAMMGRSAKQKKGSGGRQRRDFDLKGNNLRLNVTQKFKQLTALH
eukprot:COSAG01_NODE_2910_length_6877_cov_3.042785_9_plen_82_part_00